MFVDVGGVEKARTHDRLSARAERDAGMEPDNETLAT
jgi:hypothetical protein